jgi:hypothetical protein
MGKIEQNNKIPDSSVSAGSFEGDQLSFEQPGFDTKGELEEVEELVAKAAGILSSLGPNYQRIAWLLEDAVSYLDELAPDGDIRKTLLAADYLAELPNKKKASSE